MGWLVANTKNWKLYVSDDDKTLTRETSQDKILRNVGLINTPLTS